MSGEDAPTLATLQSWLLANPGWEPAPREDEGSDDDLSDDSDDGNTPGIITCHSILLFLFILEFFEF
jgi:hypothetical protein